MSRFIDNAAKFKEMRSILNDETKLTSAVTSLERIAAVLNQEFSTISAQLDELDNVR